MQKLRVKSYTNSNGEWFYIQERNKHGWFDTGGVYDSRIQANQELYRRMYYIIVNDDSKTLQQKARLLEQLA